MAKRNVLAQASKLTPVQSGRACWAENLRKEDPEQHKELLEVVDDFIKGGVTKEKFGSSSKLRIWLIGKDKERPLKGAPFDLPSEESFRRFVYRRRQEIGQ